MYKNKFFLLLILFVVVFFTSCSSDLVTEKILEEIDTSETDEYLEIAFKSMVNHDYESFIAIFEYDVSEEEFDVLNQSLPEISDCELTDYSLGGYYFHLSGGVKSYEYNYNVQTTQGDYIVQIIMMTEDDSDPEFMGFHIERGHLDNYQPKAAGISPVQIFVLIYSALCWALIIFAIVKCAKSKVKLKALWIVSIIVQHGITLTKSGSSLNYTVHFFNIGISRLVMSKGGYFSLTLIFPLVALIFLLIKKFLIKNQGKRKASFEQQEEELSRASIERISTGEPRKSEILGTDDTPDEKNNASQY